MTHTKTSHFIENLLCLGWGIACLYWSVFGDLDRLLNPFFQPFVIAAGLILILIPVLISENDATTSCQSRIPLPPLFTVALGLFITFRCDPQSFDLKTILNRSPASVPLQEKGNPFIDPIPSDEIIEVDLLDLMYSAMDPQIRAQCEGKTIQTLGQVADFQKKPHLVRLMMWCCAADARPLMIELRGKTEFIQTGEWYIGVGKVRFEETGGQYRPVLDVDSLKRTPPPEEIYLF